MFGDSNGQIKLRAKQKFKFLSATHIQDIRWGVSYSSAEMQSMHSTAPVNSLESLKLRTKYTIYGWHEK